MIIICRVFQVIGQFVAGIKNSLIGKNKEVLHILDRQMGTAQSVGQFNFVNNHTGNQKASIRKVSFSDSGRYLVFSATDSSIVANDNNGKVDTFLYDRQSGSTQCMSCSENGVRGNGDSFAIRILGDEQRVAFVSAASNLVVGDNNGHADLFIYDIPSQQLNRYDAPVSLYETVMSADGKWIAYASNFGEISIQAVDDFSVSTGQNLPYFFP